MSCNGECLMHEDLIEEVKELKRLFKVYIEAVYEAESYTFIDDIEDEQDREAVRAIKGV